MPGPDRSEGGQHGGGARRAAAEIVRAVLQVPLYWKILLANAGLIAASVGAAVLIVGGVPQIRSMPRSALVGGGVALALAVGATVNAVIVRLALRPLWELEETAERVRAGNPETRASVSPVADRRLARLIATFNEMLDRLGEDREQRRRLAVGTLRAEERARRQLAATLRDDTAQSLAAHVLRLRRIQDDASTAREDRLLATAREEAGDMLEKVRRTARAIHPPQLEDLGVVPALRACVRGTSSASTPEVEIRTEGTTEDLPQDRRVALYCILREALSNAVRHARADHVLVGIDGDGSTVRAEVADDGRGFDLGETLGDPGASLGLLAMRELAADLGGEMKIHTVLGEGTRVQVSVPIREDERETDAIRL